jgi:hypothetical protein
VLTRLGKPAFEQPVPEVVRRGCQFTWNGVVLTRSHEASSC